MTVRDGVKIPKIAKIWEKWVLPRLFAGVGNKDKADRKCGLDAGIGVRVV